MDLARRATQAGIPAVLHPSVMEQLISSSAGPTARSSPRRSTPSSRKADPPAGAAPRWARSVGAGRVIPWAMASDPARVIDPEYPNLPTKVVDAWRRAPENVVAEIIDGELSMLPRPAPRHASAASVVDQSLSPPFRWSRGGPGGWIILPEPVLRLGARPDLVVPDLAGWRRERLPTMPAAATIDVVPDWVCEVRSPSTQRHDRFKKMPMYFRHGVAHAWMVDPEAQGIEVFRRTADGWLLVLSASGDAVVRAEPFDAIELALATLWAW